MNEVWKTLIEILILIQNYSWIWMKILLPETDRIVWMQLTAHQQSLINLKRTDLMNSDFRFQKTFLTSSSLSTLVPLFAFVVKKQHSENNDGP